MTKKECIEVLKQIKIEYAGQELTMNEALDFAITNLGEDFDLNELKRLVTEAQGNRVSIEYSAEQIIKLMEDAYLLGNQMERKKYALL